jgi:hypothetical protein
MSDPKSLIKDPSALIQSSNDIIQFLEKIVNEFGTRMMLDAVIDFLSLMIVLNKITIKDIEDYVNLHTKFFEEKV